MNTKKRNILKQKLEQGTLYAILDPLYGIPFPEQVKLLISAGIEVIQYRNKLASLEQMREDLRRIFALEEIDKAQIVINDHLSLALEFPAAGLHLGQEDEGLEEAMISLRPDQLLGLSTHNREEGWKAKALGVDYIGAGPCFSSRTKPDAKEGGLGYLEFALKELELPLVGIGGIEEGNLPLLVSMGLKNAAVIGDLARAEDLPAKVERLNRILRSSP